ncbi:hypothetical protein [Aestuariimicrobium sp. Y1814]|uniref:hypothetical protein n=1 Tax=Aestuariimicrobium sp. Y1814 TaxID=3418742 RepID=UPI003DA78F94
MDLFHKNRELVAWAAIGAVALVMLGAFVEIAYLNDSWPGDTNRPLSNVARLVAGRFAPLVLLVVAALANWFVAHWREPSKNAALLSLIGLCVTGAGGLLFAVFTLIGWGGDESNGLRIFSSLLTLVANLIVVGLVAGYFFITWKQVSPAPATPYGQPGQQFGGQPGQPGLPPQQAQPGAQQQPTWQPHEASGGAWNRAGDAATGAGASTWGVPGQQSQGWQPSASPQPSAAEPQPSASPWGQPEQPAPQQSAPQQNEWNGGSAWAPASQPSAENTAEEGTVLRPNPNPGAQNPGQQWSGEQNQGQQWPGQNH